MRSHFCGWTHLNGLSMLFYLYPFFTDILFLLVVVRQEIESNDYIYNKMISCRLLIRLIIRVES